MELFHNIRTENVLPICYILRTVLRIARKWHFFATSHGESPCDAAGGTRKRQAARASLQCLYDKQILTHEDIYEFV
jgi:hypothetical protein